MKKIWIIWILIVIVIAVLSLFNKPNKPIKTSWEHAKSLLSEGIVTKVKIINRDTGLIYLTPETIKKSDTLPLNGAQFYFPIDNFDPFLKEYDQTTSVPIEFYVRRSFLEDAPLLGLATGILAWPIIIVVIGVVICILLYRIYKKINH